MVMRREGVLLLGLAAALMAVWWLPRWLARVTVATRADLTQEERDFLSRSFRVLPRDAIFPIYAPRFLPAAEARLHGDDLVLGVEILGRARAYPIAILNRREIVNDELDGVPILVTW
jgi:hypothetical protein